jgi:hypothetical protein
MQSINATIDQWKVGWTTQHERTSRYPLEFWWQVADLLIEGRLTLKNNPLVAIGRYAFDWPGALELLVARNNRAIALEKTGQIDAAIIIYEISVADEFFGTHPYDRLRIIYSQRKWWEDAIRVCEAYLSLPNRPVGQNKPHFEYHRDKLLPKRKVQA